MPPAAVLLVLVPVMDSLPGLVAGSLLHAVAIQMARPAIESLMPDFASFRVPGRANAFLRVCVSLTTIASSALGLALVDRNTVLAFAVPAAAMVRTGGSSVLRRGPALLTVGFLVGFLVPTAPGAVVAVVLIPPHASTALHGVVLVRELTPSGERTGLFTGLYHLAFSLGAVLGPVVVGGTVQITGRQEERRDMDIRILAPTGALGAGFRVGPLRRGAGLRPHVIARDAGSTDSDPARLGSGRPKLSDRAVARDLRHLLPARRSRTSR